MICLRERLGLLDLLALLGLVLGALYEDVGERPNDESCASHDVESQYAHDNDDNDLVFRAPVEPRHHIG